MASKCTSHGAERGVAQVHVQIGILDACGAILPGPGCQPSKEELGPSKLCQSLLAVTDLQRRAILADPFLEGGPIVTTSSQDPRQRDEKYAKRPRTEPRYPMGVLMNVARQGH